MRRSELLKSVGIVGAAAGAGAVAVGLGMGTPIALILASAGAGLASVLVSTGERPEDSGLGPGGQHGPPGASPEVPGRESDKNVVIRREGVLESLDCAAILISGSGRVMAHNSSADSFRPALSNGDRGERLDRWFTQGAVLQAVASAQSGSPGTGTLRLGESGSVRTFRVHAGVVGAGPEVLLILRDVTEHADAVRARTAFIANASHELRTPVSAIRAAVETLNDSDDDPALQHRVRGMLVAHLTRLEEMTRDLLDLSRLESDEAGTRFGEVDLSDVAGALAERFDVACAHKDVELRFEIDERVSVVRTDRNLLEILLSNLIDNAVKFSDEGAVVRIVARPESANLLMEVIDTGRGIPLNDQHRVFDPFYQVDPSRAGPPNQRGTGLGLAIVRHAARRLGGTVELESVWKQGTTVRVRLSGCVGGDSDSPGRVSIP